MITKLSDSAVEHKTLEVNVGKAEDGQSWGIVATSALETCKLVSYRPSVLQRL